MTRHCFLGTENRMTEGSPFCVITMFALPIFLSQLLQQLYNTADSLIVGHFLGTNALAAVGSTGSLIHLLNSFFIGLTVGAGVVISRYFGAAENDKVSRAVHTTVLLCLIFGITLTAVGVALAPQILVWMKSDEAVIDLSSAYLRFYFAGSVAMVMYNCFKGIMNAVGDSKRPLFYLFVSAGLNVLLDWLFIGVMGKGVEWAAIATVISQIVSAVLCLLQLLKKNTVYTLSLKKLCIDRELFSEILRNGIPTGVQNSVIGFANVLVQTNINSFHAVGMAACAAYSKIEGFAFLPITSYSMALTTFIGQNLGAGEYERAKKGARYGVITSVLLAEVIGLVTFLFAKPLISFFLDDGENVEEIIRIGTQQCHIEAFFYGLLSFSHCIAGICRGSGKATVPMVIMLSVWCVFRIIYITAAMAICHDIRLLFCAYPLTWFISSVIFLIYYLKSDWIHGFDKQTKKQGELRNV